MKKMSTRVRLKERTPAKAKWYGANVIQVDEESKEPGGKTPFSIFCCKKTKGESAAKDEMITG